MLQKLKKFPSRPTIFGKNWLTSDAFYLEIVPLENLIFCPVSFCWTEYRFYKHVNYIKYARIHASIFKFSLTCILPYKDRIVDSALLRKNNGQWKSVFSHILCSGKSLAKTQTLIKVPSPRILTCKYLLLPMHWRYNQKQLAISLNETLRLSISWTAMSISIVLNKTLFVLKLLSWYQPINYETYQGHFKNLPSFWENQWTAF